MLLTYGGHDFQEKEFFAMWDALPGVTYTKAPLPHSADLFKPGLEKDYDVIVCYDMVKELSPAQQRGLLALLDRGIGLVSLHHNFGSNLEWPEYHKAIGGSWLAQKLTIAGKVYGPSTYEHGQEIFVKIADKDHPITKGLDRFLDSRRDVRQHLRFPLGPRAANRRQPQERRCRSPGRTSTARAVSSTCRQATTPRPGNIPASRNCSSEAFAGPREKSKSPCTIRGVRASWRAGPGFSSAVASLSQDHERPERRPESPMKGHRFIGLAAACALLSFPSPVRTAETRSIAGAWRVQLDPKRVRRAGTVVRPPA